MQSTRKEFLDMFLARVGAKGDVPARNRAERALNLAVFSIWSKHPWRAFQSPTPHTFTTVANQRAYALPDWFGRVSTKDQTIRNATTGAPIWPVDPGELAAATPTQGTPLETPGSPSRYYISGTVGVHTQPTAGGQALEAVSSSADDTAVKVVIEGLDANDDWTRTQVTLTGVAAVALGTWKHVQSFGKSLPEGLEPVTEFTTSAGTVTLRVAGGGAALQKLLPDESALELPVLVLYPMPNAAQLVAVPVFRRPRRLRFDADPLPADWDAAIDEDMTIQWRVMAGEIAHDGAVPRPNFADLVALENMGQPLAPRRPWTGGY